MCAVTAFAQRFDRCGMGGAGVVLSTTLACRAQVADALDCRGELGVEERHVGDLIGVMLGVTEEPASVHARHRLGALRSRRQNSGRVTTLAGGVRSLRLELREDRVANEALKFGRT
jgi:hypothetical protein